MKSTETFKAVIQNYLQKRSDKDGLFADTLKKENKSIDECINYILKTVQESGCNGFADEEIYNMAVHYYDEDDIKNIKPTSAKVIVNHSIEITEEEKAEARKKALDLVVEEAKQNLLKKKTSPNAKKEDPKEPQLGLF
jgi:hypothetical protein